MIETHASAVTVNGATSRAAPRHLLLLRARRRPPLLVRATCKIADAQPAVSTLLGVHHHQPCPGVTALPAAPNVLFAVASGAKTYPLLHPLLHQSLRPLLHPSLRPSLHQLPVRSTASVATSYHVAAQTAATLSHGVLTQTRGSQTPFVAAVNQTALVAVLTGAARLSQTRLQHHNRDTLATSPHAVAQEALRKAGALHLVSWEGIIVQLARQHAKVAEAIGVLTQARAPPVRWSPSRLPQR